MFGDACGAMLYLGLQQLAEKTAAFGSYQATDELVSGEDNRTMAIVRPSSTGETFLAYDTKLFSAYISAELQEMSECCTAQIAKVHSVCLLKESTVKPL